MTWIIILLLSCMLASDTEPYWFVVEHNKATVIMDWEPMYPNRIALIQCHLEPGAYWAWVTAWKGSKESDHSDPIEFLWEHALEKPN